MSVERRHTSKRPMPYPKNKEDLQAIERIENKSNFKEKET
jgi:hypothetical protein